MSVFRTCLGLSLAVCCTVFAQDQSTRGTVQYYEQYLNKRPEALTDEQRDQLNKAESQRDYHERLEKFRSGRLGSDETQRASGRTRFSRYLEAHQNEDKHGELLHETGGAAASELEKALDGPEAKGFTLRDQGGDSISIPNIKSIYDYVLPHGKLSDVIDADERKILQAGVAPKGQTAEASNIIMKLERKHHLRRVLKPSLQKKAAEVGNKYAQAIITDGKDCDYQANDPKGDCKQNNFANADFVREEAEWLLKYYQNRAENRFKKLTVERLNGGADLVFEDRTGMKPGDKSKGKFVGARSSALSQDEATQNKYRFNYEINRDKDGRGNAALFRYDAQVLLPDFNRGKKEDLRVAERIGGFGEGWQPNSSVNSVLWESIRNGIKEELDTELDKEIKDAKAKGQDTSALEARQKNLDPEVQRRLAEVLKNYKSGSFKKYKIDGADIEVKDIDQLIAAADADCQSPYSVCVYDPDSGKLVPGTKYYGGKGYDTYVKHLDELVKREAYLVSKDPRVLARNRNQGLIGSIDYVDANEGRQKQEVVREFNERMNQFRRVLLAQRNQVREYIEASEQSGTVPPEPSEEELVLAMTTGKMVSGYGTADEPNRVGVAGQPAQNDLPDNWTNLNREGKKIDESKALTATGVESGDPNEQLAPNSNLLEPSGIATRTPQARSPQVPAGSIQPQNPNLDRSTR